MASCITSVVCLEYMVCLMLQIWHTMVCMPFSIEDSRGVELSLWIQKGSSIVSRVTGW